MFSWIKKKKKRLKITEDEAMREEWERLQKRGKKKYVWIDGAVKYGIGIPTFGVLVDLLIGDNAHITMDEWVRKYVREVISWSIISFIAARGYWNTLESWTAKKKEEEEFDAKFNAKVDFCYYCGSEVGDRDTCPQCGEKLDE